MRAVAPLPDPCSSRAVDEEHVVNALLVVVATTSLERRSQHTLDGRTLPSLRTHSLKVLTRRDPDGWEIVSEIYADARDDCG